MAPVMCSNSNEIKIGHIEDVQELCKSRPLAVPERYVREPDERPSTETAAPTTMQQVPVIDMGKLMCGTRPCQAREEMRKFTAACRDWGFFQLVNHGIEQNLLERMQEVAMDFFKLPLEEKERYPMAPGTLQGYGHAFVFSEDQKLDWCNMLALGVEPSFIRKPHLWPTNPSNFSETLEVYSANIRELCKRLLILTARSLGLRHDAFGDMFGEAVQAARMNYYPPCSRPDLVLGLSPHSDGSALTVLQQDAESVGLQILKDGTWVSVQPIPNALVINVGDTLEVLTNGRYKSVEHRVVTNRDRSRISVVTFYAPSYEVELGPMPELVSKHEPPVYKKYMHGEYNRHYITNKLQGKKTLEFAKIHSSC